MDELPDSIVAHILHALQPRDLSRCMCINRQWRALVPTLAVWSSIARTRWKHWDDKWQPVQAAGQWKQIFDQRLQADAQAEALLSRTVWPLERHQCLAQLRAMRQDALVRGCMSEDVLHRAALAEGSTAVGRRYRGIMAVHRMNALRCGDAMARLAADPEHAMAHIEQGAIILAQAHEPLRDVSASLEAAMDALRAELRRRVDAVRPNTHLQALEVLNGLLFGEREPGAGERVLEDGTLVMPPDGYGLGLQGSREEYYASRNSILHSVLASGRGLPIILCVVHMALGRSVGLPIQPVNMPMHFLTRMGDDDAPDLLFIDAFAGGRILDRHQVVAFMEDRGIEVNAQLLQPATAIDVFVRLCLNLLNLYRSSSSTSATRAVADVLLAARPDASTARAVRASAAMNDGDFAAAAADLAALPGGEQLVPRVLQQRSVKEEQWRQQRRRGGPGKAVRYLVGQVMRHKRYGYRGLITGWDPLCAMPEQWILQMDVDALPGGRTQPFYHVKVDERDQLGTTTYVAQENVEIVRLKDVTHGDLLIVHDDECEAVGAVLEGLWPGEGRYRMNEYGHYAYPED